MRAGTDKLRTIKERAAAYPTSSSMPRIIAIGDIHGCSAAFASLIEFIDPQAQDTIVTLGDYVDRGIDSKGVLDHLIALAAKCNVVPILGNHDQMMLQSRDSRSDFQFWLNCGGDSALDSYGSTGRLSLIPRRHFRFLESCVSYFETESNLFVHANYLQETPLVEHDDRTLRWLSLADHRPQGLHCSGKVAILGHTPQVEVLDLSYLVCIDTHCCDGGWLTAFEVNTKQIWQVNEAGRLRSISDSVQADR